MFVFLVNSLHVSQSTLNIKNIHAKNFLRFHLHSILISLQKLFFQNWVVKLEVGLIWERSLSASVYSNSNQTKWSGVHVQFRDLSFRKKWIRAVTKGRGAGDFPRLEEVWAPATLIQNENIGKRKMHQITKLWIKKQTNSLLIQTLIHLLKRGDLTTPVRLTENM